MAWCMVSIYVFTTNLLQNFIWPFFFSRIKETHYNYRYILDDHLFPSNPLYSCLSSLGLGICSTWAFQPLLAKSHHEDPNKLLAAAQPFTYNSFKTSQLFSSHRITRAKTLLGIYGLALSSVLVWRGTWIVSTDDAMFFFFFTRSTR